MHPTGDAHYRDVKRELERLAEDRALLLIVIRGLLSSSTPTQKENPAMFAAWAAAQSVLLNVTRCEKCDTDHAEGEGCHSDRGPQGPPAGGLAGCANHV
jgi:hypothetical protein